MEIDDKEVVYECTDLGELILAYAVSIHKYQGSECSCVVMPVHTAHFKLLSKNLIYTDVTRKARSSSCSSVQKKYLSSA